MKRFFTTPLRAFFASLGYEINQSTSMSAKNRISQQHDDKSFGFSSYVKEAQKAGVDVNDWQESTLGWPKAKRILEQTTFPYLRENAVICELGPGTGRQARHFINHSLVSEVHLFDISPWMVHFLQEYFQNNANVHVYQNRGMRLPVPHDFWVDLVFSGGCFIAFKLSTYKCYASEFFRILRPGGYCIFNYIDIETPEGWVHFEEHGTDYGGDCYAYHTGAVVDKVFSASGFDVVGRHKIDDFSTYLVLRKPSHE